MYLLLTEQVVCSLHDYGYTPTHLQLHSYLTYIYTHSLHHTHTHTQHTRCSRRVALTGVPTRVGELRRRGIQRGATATAGKVARAREAGEDGCGSGRVGWFEKGGGKGVGHDGRWRWRWRWRWRLRGTRARTRATKLSAGGIPHVLCVRFGRRVDVLVHRVRRNLTPCSTPRRPASLCPPDGGFETRHRTKSAATQRQCAERGSSSTAAEEKGHGEESAGVSQVRGRR